MADCFGGAEGGVYYADGGRGGGVLGLLVVVVIVVLAVAVGLGGEMECDVLLCDQSGANPRS